MNFADRGLQLTRASRAIKVWLAIQTFGLDAFRATIDRAIDQTLAAQSRIEADPRLELVTPASLGIVTFRRRGQPGEPALATDRRNEAIVRSLAAAGDVLLMTSTTIRGRYDPAVRVEPHDDVRRCRVRHRSGGGGGGIRARGGGRTASLPVAGTTVERIDSQRSTWGVDDLRRVPGFESITDEQADRFLATAREERHRGGK